MFTSCFLDTFFSYFLDGTDNNWHEQIRRRIGGECKSTCVKWRDIMEEPLQLSGTRNEKILRKHEWTVAARIKTDSGMTTLSHVICVKKF